MADPADRLRTTTLSGFEQLSSPDNWRQFAENLYQTNAQDIERENESRTKQILENTYGRGLGLSSIAAQMQAERERARSEALIKARRDAEVAAQQAQLSALAQASATAQEEMRRRQQAGQFQTSVDQNNKALKQQQSIANNRMLAGGLGMVGGAGLQMLGKTFQPEIAKGIRATFGLDKPGGAGGTLAIGGDPGSDIAPGGTLNAGAPFATTAAPSFSAAPTTSTDFGAGSFGDYPTSGGFDMLSSAYDSGAFAPFDMTQYLGDYNGFNMLSAANDPYRNWGYM